MNGATAPLPDVLPSAPAGRSAVWSGMLLYLLIEATAISSLLVSYYYLRLNSRFWPPAGVEPPELLLPILSKALLLVSVVPAILAARGARGGRRGWPVLLLLPLAVFFAVASGAVTLVEQAKLPYRWTDHAYGSIVFTIEWYELLHVAVVAGLGALVWALWLSGRRGLRERAALEALSLYWIFVAAASIPTFVTIQLVPWLM